MSPIRRSAASDDAEDLQTELGECVAPFVARLSSPYREAITLTELQGLTQKDAAEMLGIVRLRDEVPRPAGPRKNPRHVRRVLPRSPSTAAAASWSASRDPAQVPEDCRDAAASWAARHPAK